MEERDKCYPNNPENWRDTTPIFKVNDEGDRIELSPEEYEELRIDEKERAIENGYSNYKE